MRVRSVGTPAQSRLLAALCAAALLAVAIDSSVTAQQVVTGNNVNMVSGIRFPDGDPFLQRQNEPTMAVSTRNPLHILAGSNDYRTVDLPGPFDPLLTQKMNADAWLGLYKSLDGGRTWQSTLLPGFPQDTSASGMLSPIKGRQAGTDAVVKAGTNGLFYYAGLAFDRGANMPSTIFVARYIDHNNRESGDPIGYAGTHVVDSDTGTRFLDKPAMAVDIPRTAATCAITSNADPRNPVTETIPAGNVYLAYAAFTGTGSSQQSQILFSRSVDCGLTWSAARNLSTGSLLSQNAQIAVSPVTGHVWVSWRRFRSGDLQSDGIFITRSTDGGLTFSRPVRVAPVSPFDQGTTDTSFRTNAFQTMAVDDSGRIYVAWPERGHALLRPDRVTGDARIVVSSSTNGSTWTFPAPIEKGGLGHQIMPTLSFHAGKLRLIYYDLREDVSQVFGQFIDELPILSAVDPKPPRHTIDAYVAQALPGAQPVFTAVRLSDYAFGTIAGSSEVQRLQYNPPNLPLFREGTAPFMGDYIDLAPAPPFVQTADGSWRFNTAPGPAISHGVWTDNRDVRAPANGDWTSYTPVTSPDVGTQSLFDPSQAVPGCVVGQTGMRNQNIYTAKVTEGLFVAAPGNSKPLGAIQRAFVIIIENARGDARSYRLEIENQPPGGQASFAQFATPGAALTVLDASVPPYSTIARSVYVTSSESLARVEVSVTEITAPGGGIVSGGQASTVVLNSDQTTPSIQNPSIQNPSIQNPDIQVAEAYNPAITTAFLAPSIQNPSIQNPSIQNPSIQNPSIQNPELTNDAIANPGIINPSIQNPSIQNPSIQNPSIQNPSIQNQDLVNGAISDTTWVLSNEGNTTASYAVKLLSNGTLPPGFKSQLILHKIYRTPTATNCELALQPHTVLLANIPDPTFTQVTDLTNPSIQNPSIQNATLSLAPGDSARVTLRIVDPNRFDGIEFDAGAAITPAAVAHSVNTEDAALGITTPRVAVPLTITTGGLAAGAPGGTYLADLQTFASVGSTSWTVTEGSLPPGITLNPATGQLSGTPTTPGQYVFTVQAIDANGNVDRQTLSIKIDPLTPAGYSRIWNGVDADWNNPRNWSPAGVPTSIDSVYISAAIPVMPTLTSDVTITNLLVESGATLDSNGFTLTLLGNGDAGNTIIGSGTVVMQGFGVTARGTYPNLTIGGAVRVVGPIAASGRLSLLAGASFDLNGHSMVVGGQLRTAAGAAVDPLISGDGATLTVAGVDVEGLILDRVLLIISGGLLQQFDEVRFINYRPEDVHVTVNHTGNADPFPMVNLSFFVVPTTGRYIQANDSGDDSNSLVVNVSASLPADGSTRSATQGGAVINWLFDPNSASVGVTQHASPNPAVIGQPLTYTMVVANGGPAGATNVVLTNPISGNASFQSALTSQGSCSFSSGTVTCIIGTLASGQSAVVTIVVIPTSAGSINNAVSVTASESDPATSDNAQTVKTDVVAAASAADLSMTKLDSSDPVAVNAPFSYTLTVANAGPSTAAGVVVNDILPAGVSATSVSSSQGTCGIVGQVVTCELGSLGAAQSATVTINVLASAAGVVTNTATVSSRAADPTPDNNTATQLTMVGEATGCSAATFSGPTINATFAGRALSVRVADMNRDGTLDVVSVHQGVPGFVSVVLLRPDSTVLSSGGVQLDAPPFGFAVADFNGDTHLDVVVGVGGNPNALRLLLGNGSGALTDTGTPIAAASSFVVVALDHDSDGDMDVLARGTGGDLVLLRNDGSGGMAAPISLLPSVSTSVVVGDFNGDGRPDIAAAHPTSGFSVLLADAIGGFVAPVVYTTAASPALQSVGDLNGDSHEDLAVRTSGSPTESALRLRFGDGTGTLGPEVDPGTGNTPLFVAAADINSDGKVDLVATHGIVNTISVQLGNGIGGFGAPVHLAGASSSNPAIGDIDSNDTLDIVFGDANGTIRAYLNACGAAPVDLGLTLTESADPVNEGDEIVYTLNLRNHGDAAAANVKVTNVLATSVASPTDPLATVSSTASLAGELENSRNTYTWVFPEISPGATATIELRVTPGTGGTLRLSSSVTAAGADTNPGNNTVFETTTVNAIGRDLVVTNTGDSGEGSLRRAIMLSNGDSGDSDRIVFAIPGPAPHTITPLTGLPFISQPAVIDGTTQPGFAGAPIIELRGTGLAGNGLTITGGSTTVRGLVVNSFGGTGIIMSTSGGNRIAGNYVGTDVTGTVARPNGNAGVQVLGTSNNVIGGLTPADRNVISGGAINGVSLRQGATNNRVEGNYIGTTASGAAALGNGSAGVIIGESSSNVIGGTAPGATNVISGNLHAGVLFVVGAAPNVATGNLIQGNLIGTNAAGTAAIGNSFAGIHISNTASANFIGGTTANARNVISGNARGVHISSGPSGNTIQGNYIGLTATGTSSLPNTTAGLEVIDSANTVIGGTSAGARNVISGNGEVGIRINGAGATNTLVAGNYLGTNAAGTAALGNTRRGVIIENGATGTVVGGTTPQARNVISANGTGGVLIVGTGTASNTVLGNYVGTDASGTAGLGNLTGAGVTVADGATGNIIGGTAPGSANLISGNPASGLSIYNGATGNTVLGNVFGLTAGGGAMGNGNSTIYVDAPGNVIGGGSLAASNVIAWTAQFSGIHLDPNASGTIVKGNFIGTDRAATANLGGVGDGIYVRSSNNVIGGAGAAEGNTIASNGLNGIVIREGTGSRISGNSIFANANRGIDLFPFGTTPNDALDVDTGANNLQNFPAITSAVTTDGTTLVQGTLNSAANTTFRLEFFSNTTCDGSGHGEGQTLAGAADVTTDGAGLATFSTSISAAGNITATATDPAGNSSEFSACATTTGVDSYLVIPNRGLNALQVFDPASRTILRTIPLPSPYTFSSMLSTALVRPDGSVIVNARDGSGVAVALKITSAGIRVDSQPSGAEFLQQIAFDPLDPDRETVIGGTPFLPEVRAVSPVSGSGTRIIRTGANFIGIATAANGNIYAGAWCGPDNGAVLLYSSGGSFISTFAQVGTDTGSCEVNGLARDNSGNLYVAQNSSNRVARFDNTGAFIGFITASSFNAPSQVFFNPQDGLLYVGNDADDRLTVVTTQGEPVSVVRMGGSGIGVPGAFDGSNAPPVASAGPDQIVPVGSTVQLNGAASSDPEESPLTYLWILNTRPQGSTAVLSATNIANPTFVADLPGTYVAQLVVNDGTVNSPSDTVTITTQNQLPLAHAGVDQANVPIGGTVTLDGRGSSDPDGQTITYLWSFVLRPGDSTATLTGATSAQPTFVADRGGLYRLQLVVNDGQADSIADTVDIVTVNQLPTADAGVNQTVLEGATVQLTGAASSDPDQNPLTYAWTLVSRPPGSQATLANPAAANPTFVADVAGGYTARLVVNDGFASSAPDDVSITATSNRIVLSLIGTPLLGVARQATLQVVLPSPAPLGGVTVSVTSDDTGVALVVAPGTAVIPEGASTGTVTAEGIAVGTTVVRATAAGYQPGATSVGVTNSVLTLPASLNVAFGQTASLPVNLAQAAPAGGVVVTLVSSLSGVIEIVTPTVTIPEGALSGNGTVRGLGIGTATVTAEHPSFASAASQVSSTGSLNIIQSSASLTPGFPTSITVQLESGGSPVGAPAGGIQVTLSSSNPACIAASTILIPEGVVNAAGSLTYGGTATLPCTTTISANASNLTTDSISVTVDPQPGIQLFSLPARVGGGLQKGALTARLGASNHGGATMRIQSSDPALALVSASAASVGTAFIDVDVPNGSTDVSYYIHGTSAAVPGTVTLTASASGFTESTGTVHVVTPILVLQNLPANVTSLDADQAFYARTGIANETNAFVQEYMAVRAGADVAMTVTNSNATVAQLRTSAGAGQTRTVTIAGGQFWSPTSVAAGGVALDPLAAGSTTVALTAAGFNNVVGGSASVTVTGAGIQLFSLPARVGGGLQKGALTARLGGSQHGGVTVRIQSSDPAIALVSASPSAPGIGFIDVNVPNGSTDVSYYIHGTSASVPGTVTLTASAPGFTESTGTVHVVTPILVLQNLPADVTSLDADHAFYARTGVANETNAFVQEYMAVRAGTDVTMTVTNSNATVAQLRTSAGVGQTRTVTIAGGQFWSPTSVAAGGVALDPLAAGSTTVALTATGFNNGVGGSAPVTVTGAGIQLFSLPARVGGGLQKGALTARLGGSQHGGVTVRIQSSDPAIALVSPGPSAAGTGFIDVNVPNGSTDVSYYVHGTSASVAGTVTLTASASGFTDGIGTVHVVTPILVLQNLPSAVTSLDADHAFYARTGIANETNAFVQEYMAVRAGTDVTMTVTNSNAAVAQLRTSAGLGQTRTVTIAGGQFWSPTSVAAGGIALDPLSGGITTVAAAAPGFSAAVGGSLAVTVNSPGIQLFSLPARVGGGLQKGAFTARLGGSQHGGVTLRLSSSNAAVMLLSSGASTAGTAFIDVVVPNGQTDVSYYVHGASPTALATVTITATAAGFSDATGAVTIAPPILVLQNLSAATTSLSADESFYIRTGVANETNSFIQEYMAVRAGTDLTMTVSNSNAAVGQLRTSAGPGQTRTVTIAGGQFWSPTSVASGGVAFDPSGPGTTVVSAAASGFNSSLGGSLNVTVTAPGITLFSLPTTVGAGLQSGAFTARLGGSNHGGVTMRIASSNAAVALVSPDAVTPGTAFIDVIVPNGQTDASYYIQGTSTGSTGTVTITASAPAFTTAHGLTHIETAALQIEGLPTSIDATAANVAFWVRVGLPAAGNGSVQAPQAVRAGSSLVVTLALTHDAGTPSQLVTSAGGAQTRQVTITGSNSNSPTTVTAGGVEFDPLTGGFSVVGATIPGVTTTTGGQVMVEVTASLVGTTTGKGQGPVKKKGG